MNTVYQAAIDAVTSERFEILLLELWPWLVKMTKGLPQHVSLLSRYTGAGRSSWVKPDTALAQYQRGDLPARS